jgi:hypothetical protein
VSYTYLYLRIAFVRVFPCGSSNSISSNQPNIRVFYNKVKLKQIKINFRADNGVESAINTYWWLCVYNKLVTCLGELTPLSFDSAGCVI